MKVPVLPNPAFLPPDCDNKCDFDKQLAGPAKIPASGYKNALLYFRASSLMVRTIVKCYVYYALTQYSRGHNS